MDKVEIIGRLILFDGRIVRIGKIPDGIVLLVEKESIGNGVKILEESADIIAI